MSTRDMISGVSSALCAFAAAASVCQSMGYFQEPDPASALGYGLLAALLGIARRSGLDQRGLGARWFVPLAGLVLVALGLPIIAVIGPVLWGILAWVRLDSAWLRRIRGGLGAAGGLILVGHLVVPFWIRLEIAAPELTSLAKSSAWVLDVLGHEASAEGAIVHLSGSAGATSVLIDPFKLGGLFAFLGTGLLLILHGRSLNKRGPMLAVALASLALAYCLVRVLVAASIPQIFSTVEVLLEPTLVYASFFPCAVMLGLLVARYPVKANPDERLARDGSWTKIAGAALAGATGLLLLCLAIDHYESGKVRPGMVIMDESHGQWEASDTPFDTESWGRGSTYNYAEFSDLLGRHFDHRVHRSGPITAKLLEEAQVIVLKTPSSPYSPEELEALHDFVVEGGGIWLIGDHTNLYGMSDCLNPIAAWAGMHFRNDATYDSATGGTTYNSGDHRYHPSGTASGALAFQTSCSLAVTGPGVEPVIVGWRLTGEYADYGHPNFFGDLSTDMVDRTGQMLQAAIGPVGAGRIAAFTDSTIFSNFSIFDRGISELALRTVQSLRHSGSLPRGWRELAALGGIILCLIGLGLAPRRILTAPLTLVAGAALALLAGRRILGTAEVDLFAPPLPADTYRDVAFIEGASTFARTSFVEEASTGLQDKHAGHAHARQAEPLLKSSLSTLINWTLRIDDARPRVENSVEDAIANGAEMIVIFDPVVEPTHTDQHLLVDFVRHGGVFLVLDDLANARGSTANDWLLPFDLELVVEREDGDVFQPRPAAQMGFSQTVSALAAPELVLSAMNLRAPVPETRAGTTYSAGRLAVSGGSSLLLDGEGHTVSATVQLGRGRAGAFTRSSALTNDALGGRFDLKPNSVGVERHRSAVTVLETFLDYQTLESELKP